MTNVAEISVRPAPRATFDRELGAVLIARAAGLRPLIASKAEQHEQDREICAEVVEAYTAAGLAKMAAPQRWGGYGICATDMAKVAIEIARGCPSTGWVLSIANSNAWLASTTSEAMQERIFADGVPSLAGPQNGLGHITARDGTHYVSGTWAYASNSHHATGMIAPCLDEAGQPKFVYLPMTDVELQNTWKVAGMRATGSDTIVARDVRIDTDQFADLVGVCGAFDFSYPKELTDYWTAFPLLRAKALGVFVGTAYGLLDAVAATQERGIIYTNIARKGDSEVFRARIGEAGAMIRAAETLTMNVTGINDSAAEAGRDQSEEERTLCRNESAMAISLLHTASNHLMNLAGSSAFMESHPAQRFWRDLHVGSRHAIFHIDSSYEAMGNVMLGLETGKVVPSLFL